ncbi:MAG: T9SS type A sorting domain-containing protein [Muribaculaceae bacterium]|nr:T9SS type A sorting domain-containing protein [Muribaculaceae bacterium]
MIKNSLKKVLTLIAAIIIGTPIMSAENPGLRITDVHDNTSVFLVDERLRLDMTGEDITIHSSNSEVSVKVSDLKTLSYINKEFSGITDISRQEPTLEIRDNILKVVTAEGEDLSCRIFDLKGTIFLERTISGEDILHTESFPKGVYVVKIDRLPAFKIIVK